MKIEKTCRGFVRIDFVDSYGVECSLQESSSEAAIWLGCNDASPKQLVPGQGWVDIEMPEKYIANTRMHLTRAQAKELIPHLIKFVETGELQ